MPAATQYPQNSPVFDPQLAHLAVEQQPADGAEALRLEQLRQLIEAAPDTADLREFAEPASCWAPATRCTAAAPTSG